MTEEEIEEREKIAALWVKIRETEGAELSGMEEDLMYLLQYIQDNLSGGVVIDSLAFTLEKMRFCLYRIMRTYLVGPPQPARPANTDHVDLQLYTPHLAGRPSHNFYIELNKDRLMLRMRKSYYPFVLLKKYVELQIPKVFEEAKKDLVPFPDFWEEHAGPLDPPTIDEIITIKAWDGNLTYPLAERYGIDD